MSMCRTLLVILAVALGSCSSIGTDADDLVNRKLEYALYSGSQDWGFDGMVTITENDNGTAGLEIVLEDTEGDRLFPVHLHRGPFGSDGEVATMLEPVSAGSGRGVTPVVRDNEERAILFDELKVFDGHIKVHLSHSGPGRDITLAYGNIGLHAIPTGAVMP